MEVYENGMMPAGNAAGSQTTAVPQGAAQAAQAVPPAGGGRKKKQKKKNSHFWPGFFVGFLAAFVLAGALIAGLTVLLSSKASNAPQGAGLHTEQISEPEAAPNPEDLNYDRINSKIRLLQKIISKNYLFDEDPETVEESIYSGLLDGLGDPYSVYYTVEEYTDLTEESEGQYSGIGALLSQDPDTGLNTIVRVFPGSPAEEAGLMAGDIIFSVDGHEMTGEDLDFFVSTYIRGLEGTELEMEIRRGEDLEKMTFKITRRKVEVPSVESKMLEGNVGYILVTEFDAITWEQFAKAVDALQEQGMEKLVIDLRNNPGGVVDSAVRMLDYMLPKGLLVYTAGRDGTGEKYYAKDDHEVNIPTAILINGNSASASEIFAGAYKDYGRAKLVGTTSFGKGIVQFILPLGDGSAVKLTTEHYYTPNGFDLHGLGIEPDITVEPEKDDVQGDYEHDSQLRAAVEALQ